MKRMMTAAVMLMCGTNAFGQVHATDVVLRAQGGVLETGTVSSSGSLLFPARVFLTTLGEFDFANDPGFDSGPGAFPPGGRIGFDILGGLRVWDGTDFDQLAQPRMRLRFGANERFTPMGLSDVVAGFGISVASNGQYHRHVGFTLQSQAIPPTVPAEAGIYALSLRLWSDFGVGTSAPMWIVFNQQSESATAEQASQWLSNQLQGEVCAADVGAQGGIAQADGLLDNNDFAAFIPLFFANDSRADVGSQGGAIGPDGQFGNDDFAAFVTLFFGGC